MTKEEAEQYKREKMEKSLWMRSYDDIHFSLVQLLEIRHDIEMRGKEPDQNLKSWINALYYCLSDKPMILGKAD